MHPSSKISVEQGFLPLTRAVYHCFRASVDGVHLQLILVIISWEGSQVLQLLSWSIHLLRISPFKVFGVVMGYWT